MTGGKEERERECNIEREGEIHMQTHPHIGNLEVGQVHKDGRVSLQLVLHHLEGSLEETAPTEKVKLRLKKKDKLKLLKVHPFC